MACLDHTMIRRERSRAGFVAVLADLAGALSMFVRRRLGRVEDLNDYMLRDIGFLDGRVTGAAMRRAANCRDAPDQF